MDDVTSIRKSMKDSGGLKIQAQGIHSQGEIYGSP